MKKIKNTKDKRKESKTPKKERKKTEKTTSRINCPMWQKPK